MHDPVIKGKLKVTGGTRFIPIIVEHKEYEIQWSRNKSISTNAREPDTLEEPMTRTNGHLNNQL